MADYTANISLVRPILGENALIREHFNYNVDIIDGRFSSTYLAIQAKNAVTITGGSITGITDLAVADGGTGSSNASDARTALGVAIGSDVQAYDAGLLSIAALTTAANKMIYTTASDTYTTTDLTVFARTILDDAAATNVRTTLGLVIGTNVQAWDTQLDDIAALAVTNGNFIVGDGSNWVAESGATVRASLGLTIGTNVQAYDAGLTAIAALAMTDSNMLVGNGTTWVLETGSTLRTSIGLGSVEDTALSTWAGTTNITTLGTIVTGTWSATTIAINKGGTGQTAKTAAFDALSPVTTLGDIIYGNATVDNVRLAANSTGTNNFLRSVSSGAPTWATLVAGDMPTAIDAVKIADGTVTNAEFQYINSLSSNAQNQLTSLKDLTNYLDSPCVIAGGVVSNGTTAGTFKVTEITLALLRASDSVTAALTPVTLDALDDQPITAAGKDYFVIFTYGTPTGSISINEIAPNGYNAIPIGKVGKDSSNHVHYASGGYRFSDGVRKLHERAATLRFIELAYGCTIAHSGDDNFTMAQGVIYGGINRVPQSSYDSASTTFTTVYQDDDSGWKEGTLVRDDIAFVDGGGGEDTITTVDGDFVATGYVEGDKITISGAAEEGNNSTFTILGVVAKTINVATESLTEEPAGNTVTLRAGRNKIDYEHYDDGSGTLEVVGVGRYGCHWVYKHIGDGHVYVLYGRGSYKLVAAELAPEPTKPDHLADFGCLIGCIIAPQDGDGFTTIQMVTDTFFTGTNVSNHAELGNLDYASAAHTGFATSGANSNITSLTGLSTPLGAAYGGTGIANNAAETITIGGAGTYGVTLTLTNTTDVTLPTTGTLATLAGTEELTNKTLTSPKLNEDVAITSTATELNLLDTVTTTATQFNYLNAATGTTGTTNTNLVFSTSPTFVTPALGTPASGTLTSCDGTASSLTAGAVTNATFTTALTVNTGTLTLTAHSNNDSVLTIGTGASSISGSNTGDQTDISGNAATVTVDATTTDTTCFVAIFEDASGSLTPHTDATLTYNAASGVLTSTFAGALTGNVTGNCNGSSGSCTGLAATATALADARTIGGVSFNGTANITVATATGGFTVSGGALALGANSITMSGSIGVTGTRVTKLWADDIESTNAPTVGGSQISSANLSDVDSIGMLDEGETVTGYWSFTNYILVSTVSDSNDIGPYIFLKRKKDGDPDDDVDSGDILGWIDFGGYHTVGYYGGAKIQCVVDGDTGAGDMPGRLEFLTTPNASATPTLRLAIDNAGNVKMGDGAWTNYINVTAGGALTSEGTASITADTVATITGLAPDTATTASAQTNIVSILNAGLYVGRDTDNTISFVTDNVIIFQTNGAEAARFGSTGELDMGNNTVGFTLQTATGDGTTDIDWTLGNHFKFTFGAQADELTFTADPTNPCHLYLIVKQDGEGGRDLTLPGDVTWLQTEPTWTDGGADKVIIVGLVWDGTTYWAGATEWEA